MNKRKLDKTGKMVTEIGLGTWQLGTKWGDPFNEQEAEKILQTAYDHGINFVDTADIYNDGNSEKAIGKFLRKNKDAFYIVTKCGRALNPHTDEMYTPEAIVGFVEASLSRMELDQLDMVLLHCPPTSVYRKDEIFTQLAELKSSGKIAGYGVSIETVQEGLMAMEYEIDTIEVVFNMFRMKPVEQLLVDAKKNDVGVIARVPLASGLLTGKYHQHTVFGEKDHRSYNRKGEVFDKGETFSGVDYQLGLKAVEALKQLFQTEDLIPYAIKWILMHDGVTSVIPGASNAGQVVSNIRAAQIPELSTEQMAGVKKIYETYIKETVHPYW